MAGSQRIVKRLRYRDLTGKSQAAHVAHWKDFEWQAGPVIVASVGRWGTVQVWAASEAEGKRVVRHAASISGWNPDAPGQGRWIVTQSASPRYGRTGLMRVQIRRGYLMVSKRSGPSGAPEAVPVVPDL